MVTTRRSILTMRSTIGIRKINPGPFVPSSLPRRKITPRWYSRRMRIICGRMITASKTIGLNQTSNFANSLNMECLPQVSGLTFKLLPECPKEELAWLSHLFLRSEKFCCERGLKISRASWLVSVWGNDSFRVVTCQPSAVVAARSWDTDHGKPLPIFRGAPSTDLQQQVRPEFPTRQLANNADREGVLIVQRCATLS